MRPEIRPLTRDDAETADALAAEAFGAPARALPEPWPAPGTCPWGAFRGQELAAVATVRAFRSWFGGEAVPLAGIAAVAVRPEHRGTGLLAPLFATLLADARDRGAVVSGLYPTAPGIYRRLGYEIVGELADVELPVAPLARIAAPAGITLRRADPGDEHDVTAHRGLYERWARAQNGPLTREGPLQHPLGGHDTVTLALDAQDTVVGYAAWSRAGNGSGTATVTVHELIAHTAPATAALWRLLGGFVSMAGTVQLRTSGTDATRLVLPASPWRPVRQWPYCLRLLDVAGAFRARGVAPIDADLPFSVTGDGLDGTYRLTAHDGVAACEPGDGTGPTFTGPTFTGRGLALAYAGAQSCANLRFAGLLGGPDTDDARWDALLGGRQFHIRNYF